MSSFIDKFGQHISEAKWNELKWDPLYKILEVHQVEFTKVITCWNGDLGPEKNFETSVFDPDNEEIEKVFYQSEEEALSGHKKVLNNILSKT